MDKNTKNDRLSELRLVTISYLVQKDELEESLEDVADAFARSQCNLWRTQFPKVEEVHDLPSDGENEILEFFFPEDFPAGDPNCPTRHGDGHFYQKHDGPGAEHITCDCLLCQ